MGKLKQLQDDFLDTLTPQIASFGFKYRKSYRDFVRPFPLGRHSFHISVINHTQDFDVTVDFAIRFDAVENARNKERSLLSEREKKNTYTVGSEFGNWIEQRQKRWSFHSRKDIDRNVSDIISGFSGPILIFFDDFSSPLKVMEFLQNQSTCRKISPFDDKCEDTIKIMKEVYSNQSVDTIPVSAPR